MISDTINRIIPIRSPFCTTEVCCPSKVASRITSRHQNVTFIITDIIPKIKTKSPRLKPCLHRTAPKTLKKAEKDVYIGHGLGSTIWNP